MKIRIAAAAAALVALAAPAAAADDKLTYDSVTHCAAFNLLLAQVYTAGNDSAAKKSEIDTYSGQATALMVVASMMNKTPTEQVQADVSAKNDAMIKTLGGDGGAEKLVSENLSTCDTMGKAAKQALDEVLAEKKG